MMNPWVKQKWVRALRSGEYEQGNGWLICGERRSYCCLGVLAEEMVPEFIRPVNESLQNLGIDGSAGTLPDDLAIMFGLDRNSQYTLAQMNDEGDCFLTIADWIEREL